MVVSSGRYSKKQVSGKYGGDDETRTRDLCRDSERFISTCNDLQEHGRHPKSFQDSLRHRYCVPRCVPRFSRQSRETHRLVAGACNAPKTLVLPFRYKLPETPCSSPHASCKVFAASELARRSRSIW